MMEVVDKGSGFGDSIDKNEVIKELRELHSLVLDKTGHSRSFLVIFIFYKVNLVIEKVHGLLERLDFLADDFFLLFQDVEAFLLRLPITLTIEFHILLDILQLHPRVFHALDKLELLDMAVIIDPLIALSGNH